MPAGGGCAESHHGGLPALGLVLDQGGLEAAGDDVGYDAVLLQLVAHVLDDCLEGAQSEVIRVI